MNEHPLTKSQTILTTNQDIQKIKKENSNLKQQLIKKNQEIEEITAILSSYNIECDRIEYALQNIISALTPMEEESLLITLVRNLGKTLNLSLVILAEIKEKNPYLWETLVVCKQGEIKENFTYNIKGTPWEQVYEKKQPLIYYQGYYTMYNEANCLLGNKAESYIGFPLVNHNQELIGCLCLIDENPLIDQYWSLSILKIFASQITSELQNQKAQSMLINVQKQLELEIEERSSQLLSTHLALQTEITEKEEVKTALIESKEQYLSLVNSLQDVIFQRNLTGNWSFVNTAWTELTGFTVEETIGKHFSEFIHPEDRATCLDCIHPIVENDKSRQTQVRYLTKDGNYRWMDVHKQIIFNDKGETIGLSGTLRDITVQKIAKEALEQEQKQLYNLINNAPVAIAMFDQNMNYVSYSQQWLKEFHLKEKSLMGRCHYEIFPDLSPDRIELYKRVLKGEYLAKNEDSLILNNGIKLYYKWAMNPWFTMDNKIGGIIMVIQGINELVEARNSAVENAKVKSHFLATMSHEIRTPMNGVLGMAELLLKSELDEQQKDFLKTLYQSGKNLLTIINEILDFSKLEAGEMNLEKVDININSCLEEVVDLLGIKAQEKDLELLTFIDYQVENLNVQGDPTRLRQILLNLVGNALKFTDKGSVIIKVALEEERENSVKIRFQVKDTGIGISSEYQEKIFESFSQMDLSTTRKYGGTGLGLAICKQLVMIMNGEIGVKSEADQGSTFWFTVNLEKQTEPLVVTIPPKQYLKGLRLLIISHHIGTQKMLESYGLSWEMEVKTATTIQEGITYFNQENLMGKFYDMAIIEMQYPDLDQQIFTYLTKINPELADLRCIWLISIDQQNQVKNSLKNPHHHYLVKPIKPSKLADSLINIAQFSRGVAKDIEINNTREISPNNLTSDFSLNRDKNKQSLLKILLVEDTLINQKVILNQLKILGYYADCVNNGEEALSILEKHHYDLILMDCLMPYLDGYETTKILRKKQDNHAQIIIIAMTANAMAGEREKCLEAGMNDYLSKPVALDNLEVVLNRWQNFLESQFLPKETNSNCLGQVINNNSPESPDILPIDLAKINELVKDDLEFRTELLNSFFEDASFYLKELKIAIKEQNFDLIVYRSHQLKGMSSMVAIAHFPQLAQTLQHQAEAQKLENAQELLLEMENIFQQVQDFVEKESRN